MSRNWSAATSWADGSNWSNAESTQRVYEYAVEPEGHTELSLSFVAFPQPKRPTVVERTLCLDHQLLPLRRACERLQHEAAIYWAMITPMTGRLTCPG